MVWAHMERRDEYRIARRVMMADGSVGGYEENRG